MFIFINLCLFPGLLSNRGNHDLASYFLSSPDPVRTDDPSGRTKISPNLVGAGQKVEVVTAAVIEQSRELKKRIKLIKLKLIKLKRINLLSMKICNLPLGGYFRNVTF